MAGIVLDLLHELDIECKLLSITGDNITNNETLIDEVELSLHNKFPRSNNLLNTPRFSRQNSFIWCIAYILNRIVKKLLETLQSGNAN
jgi:hypothetical protein